LHLAQGAAFCAYTDGLIDQHRDPTSADGQRLPGVVARAYGRHAGTGTDPDRPPVANLLAESIVRDMLGGAAPDDDVGVAVLRAGPNCPPLRDLGARSPLQRRPGSKIAQGGR